LLFSFSPPPCIQLLGISSAYLANLREPRLYMLAQIRLLATRLNMGRRIDATPCVKFISRRAVPVHLWWCLAQRFDIAHPKANCKGKGGDFLAIGKKRFCQNKGPTNFTSTTGKLTVSFNANKKVEGEGAECTIACSDLELTSSGTGCPESGSGTSLPPTGGAECELKPEIVQSTAFSSLYAASHVLILAEVDAGDANGVTNFWLAEDGKTTGQGFTLKVGDCKMLIAGCQIKNKGKEFISGVWNNWWSTKEFRVSGSMNENGPWETLLEDQLVDTTFSGGNYPASLRNFTFEDPVEIQFLKFDLISFWGSAAGGGIQYFAPIFA